MNKQTWNIGDIVKVGFVANLIVEEKVNTIGDGKPDLYVLRSLSNDRFYSFVPHNGLTRCDSRDEARLY